jgi:biotin carboxylase
MISPWLVFIESNSTGTGSTFATTARDIGYSPIVLARDPKQYSFLQAKGIDFIEVDTSQLSILREVISDLTRKTAVAGIYSSSEYFVETAALLSNHLGLAGASPGAIAVCRNKWRQRLVLRGAGFPVPRFHLVQAIRDLDACVEDVGLPCVLKPTSGTGSVGVRLCRSLDEARQHASLLLGRGSNERGISIEPELLVEQYIRGVEYSVETFCHQVVGITRKYISPEPYFVETGHDYPAILSHDLARRTGETVLQALAVLDLRWGPAHTEIRLSEEGPVIVEVNPRLAGGLIPELVKLATGINLISTTVAAVANVDIDIVQECNAGASIRFLVPQKKGTLVRVDGLDEARKMRGVVDARLYYESDHQCKMHNDFRDRIGHIIARGNNSEEAAIAAEAALRQLRVRLDAHPA